jgi:hypothetical protein
VITTSSIPSGYAEGAPDVASCVHPGPVIRRAIAANDLPFMFSLVLMLDTPAFVEESALGEESS